MTICNWQLRPNAATIMTDSLRYNRFKGHAGFTSKLIHMPHLNLAFVVRGLNPIVTGMVFACRENMDTGGIDRFAADAPEMLRVLCADLAKELKRTDQDGLSSAFAGGGMELIAFGWSEAEGRIVGRLFSSYQHDFEPAPIPDGVIFAPEIRIELSQNERRAIAKGKMPEALIVGAKAQRRDCLATEGYGVGGELFVAELRRGSYAMKPVYRFEEDFAP